MIEFLNVQRRRGELMMLVGIVDDENGFAKYESKYLSLTKEQSEKLSNVINEIVINRSVWFKGEFVWLTILKNILLTISIK